MNRKIVYANAVVLLLLTGFCFLYPAIRGIVSMMDSALGGPGIPKVAWRLHHNLTPRYAAWAKARIESSRAENLSTQNISGTEWPLFGSCFYLWGTEDLQAAWEAGDHSDGSEPGVYAREAIIAASELVIDPKQAAWVRKHWGAGYLTRENVFYRILYIAALTSREKLLQDGVHTQLLREQVDSFASELDASRTGLLDYYPGECYPGDVMDAIACIRRADAVLGTDHSDFARRSLRAFTGPNLDRHGLPPYSAIATTGRPVSEARGCGNSYVGLTSPELWPDQAKAWFESYDHNFWQEKYTISGYREHAKDVPHTEWLMDVDAGPVITGQGVAACAFGLGAARKNGRFDRAYPLSMELMAEMWELPNGVLAGPRFLSNATDAPLLGEAGHLVVAHGPAYTGIPRQNRWLYPGIHFYSSGQCGVPGAFAGRGSRPHVSEGQTRSNASRLLPTNSVGLLGRLHGPDLGFPMDPILMGRTPLPLGRAKPSRAIADEEMMGFFRLSSGFGESDAGPSYDFGVLPLPICLPCQLGS